MSMTRRRSPVFWGDQKQSAVVPEGCHVGDPLYGPFQQQGIHTLLEDLPAVPGPEVDALVGQLRFLLECQTHSVLDNAGGPAVAQQTCPLWGEVCRARPHLDPVFRLWKLQKSSKSWCGDLGRVCGWFPCWRQCERTVPVSRFSVQKQQQENQDHQKRVSWLTLLGRRSRLRAGLVVFGLLNKRHWRASHPVGLTDGPDSVLEYLGFWTQNMRSFEWRRPHRTSWKRLQTLLRRQIPGPLGWWSASPATTLISGLLATVLQWQTPPWIRQAKRRWPICELTLLCQAPCVVKSGMKLEPCFQWTHYLREI